jgi:hypothetical protein
MRLENLAHVLHRQREHDKTQPPATDQQILQALIGKPFKPAEPQVVNFRKVG